MLWRQRALAALQNGPAGNKVQIIDDILNVRAGLQIHIDDGYRMVALYHSLDKEYCLTHLSVFRKFFIHSPHMWCLKSNSKLTLLQIQHLPEGSYLFLGCCALLKIRDFTRQHS
jgi:hypothetical protein